RPDVRVGQRVGLPEALVGAARPVVGRVRGAEPQLGEQILETSAAVRGPRMVPGRRLGLQDALRQLGDLVGGAADLRGEGVPLAQVVDRAPGRERATPADEDRPDAPHQPTLPGRTSATIAAAASATGTCRRSPVRRSLISTVPCSRPLPTTTIVGTPRSSASLNLTPGLTLGRSS